MTDRLVILMRGLPGCGKSTTARRLAGEQGIVCETDEYFYTQTGEDPLSYDYDAGLLSMARNWNLSRFASAVRDGRSPIVVDRGNGLNNETCEYVAIADEYNFRVELCEPDSPWWQELRVLLRYREFVADELFDRWATALATHTRYGHRVPADTIRGWMRSWKADLTVDDVRNAATHPGKASTRQHPR